MALGAVAQGTVPRVYEDADARAVRASDQPHERSFARSCSSPSRAGWETFE
jgi:hypothetical protein